MQIIKCPKCKCVDVFSEDKPDGKSTCASCEYYDTTEKFRTVVELSSTEITAKVHEVASRVLSVLNLSSNAMFDMKTTNGKACKFLFIGRVLQDLFRSHFFLSYEKSEEIMTRTEGELNATTEATK